MNGLSVPVAEEPLITLHNLSKTFGLNKALDNINLTLEKGEVHCLAGTNGCGKSTLIKIISGVYTPDDGAEIGLDGNRWSKLTPEMARELGVQVIYQDLALFPNLSVAENIAFELNMQGMLRPYHSSRLKRKAAEILDELNFMIDLDAKVESLPIAQRQQVAICRALVADARLVIMDEPTASLTRAEVNKLLRTVHYLKSKGITVVFVSHRLDEVREISDRVTVIRDGRMIGTYPAVEMTSLRLTELMTGVKVQHCRKVTNTSTDKVLLELIGFSRTNQYQDVSLTIREGEVVGLCGLLGSGRTELALSLFGITRPERGEMRLEDRTVRFRNHLEAIRAGIAYVSEDRLTLGMVQEQSVADNAVLTILDRLRGRFHLVNEYRKLKIVHEWIHKLDIRVADPLNPIGTLSGGNQQKVVLAKWILTQPKLLILDAPTVGVDVGAKDAIYQLIHQLAAEKIAILLISDEIPEVYYNCDRVLHFHKGRVVNEINPALVTEEYMAEVING